MAYLASGKELVVSSAVQEVARSTKAQLMRDPEWVARYLAGGQADTKLMLACNLRIAARAELLKIGAGPNGQLLVRYRYEMGIPISPDNP